MHGREIHWQKMAVSYHVLDDAQPAFGMPRIDEEAAAIANSDSDPRKPPTAKQPTKPPNRPAGGETQPQPDHIIQEPTVVVEPTTEGPEIGRLKEELRHLKEQLLTKTEENDTRFQSLQAQYDEQAAQRVAAQDEAKLLRAELAVVTSTSQWLKMQHGHEVKRMQAEMELLRDAERAQEVAEAQVRLLEETNRKRMQVRLLEETNRKREEEEARRRAAEVNEMRRRMAEMAAEELARKEAERQERVKQQKEKREREEREEKARREREEQARLAREREEEERKEREARERIARAKLWRAATLLEERRCRARDVQMRGIGLWTVGRALVRIQSLMDEFESLKFSEMQPLSVSAVPWPVLIDPLVLQVADISWDTVESFFARVKQMEVDVAVYNALVQRVHRMFHPDRWRARGILESVMDAEVRAKLEAAGNVVSQAMSPLWTKTRI
ncbi:hypothetical protein C8F01DRAFT_87542 [Mycena amicta]|nr:hypothetical protein C8F01DRAFT_87542 [Mycena amicta]